MRNLRILLLNMQQIAQERARSFVWLLSSLLQPIMLIGFWTIAVKSNNTIKWSTNSITGYYLLLIVVSTFMPWVEETISKEDILEGKLSQYLLKPYSYYWFKFFEELPYRILQCFYALVIILFVFVVGHIQLIYFNSVSSVLLFTLMAVSAYMMAFNFKLIVGLTAFWFTEVAGILNLVATLLFIFAGYIMPLSLFPAPISKIAFTLPFAYMVYFPITALQGKLTTVEALEILSIQVLWVCLLFLVYKVMWSKGIKQFTSFGQ